MCQAHARQAYSHAATRGNAPRRVDPATKQPWGGRQQRRAQALASDGGRCRALTPDGHECGRPATRVVRLRDRPGAALVDERRSLCEAHAQEHRAAAARHARIGTAPPPQQLTAAAARIVQQLDDLGAPAGVTHAEAHALLHAAGLSAGGGTPRALAVAYRRARDGATPQLQLVDVDRGQEVDDARGEAAALALAAVQALRPDAQLLATALAAARRAGAPPDALDAATSAAAMLGEALSRLAAAFDPSA